MLFEVFGRLQAQASTAGASSTIMIDWRPDLVIRTPCDLSGFSRRQAGVSMWAHSTNTAEHLC